MQGSHQQDTFISGAELLQLQAQRAADAATHLRAYMQSVTDPYNKALESAALLEDDLEQLLLNYAEKGEENVLETRFQYTADSEEPAPPATAEEALQDLIAINSDISEQLEAVAGNAIPDSVAEALDTLWRDVDSLCRRVSMIHVTLADV